VKVSVVFLLSVLFVGAGIPLAAEIPDKLLKVEGPSGPPAWISEQALRAAMDAQGMPAGSRLKSVGYLFDYWPSLSSDLEDYASNKDSKIAQDGTLAFCEPQIISYYYGERARNLKRLLELSTTVTSVRVLDTKPGFKSGQAGELLEVEVLSILKDTGTAGVPRDGFYLFDRYARMVIDGRALCLGDRQVPMGEFLLFQIRTDLPDIVGLPTYFLDDSALISSDGAFYGSLLDHSVDPKKLVQQLSTLDQLLPSEHQEDQP
jgi:hypothetical protein